MNDFYKKLQDPPKEYRPIPFWSWNEKLDANETKEQIKEMEKAGIGGFFMHARGGLQTGYLSEEWFENVTAALDEGAKNGMFAYGYDENGWPSGFGDGAVNGKGIDYQQKYLRCSITDTPAEDEFTIANIELDGEIYHLYYEVNTFYVDTMNAAVTKEFIKSTHEKYRDTLGGGFSKMKGFFTDEPQVSRNGIPWSFILDDEYKKIYGESILPHLPKLFYRLDGFCQFRFRFWKLVRDLFTDNFMKEIGEWCRENGSSLTGHAVLEEGYYEHTLANGCCMPLYEYMDIPGMDHLCRILPSVQTEMQLVSAANQLGKKKILSETFAGCGWHVSFEELREIYEHQLVHGINLLCQHLEAYSLRGIRKRDYPASLFRHQPWWNDYKIFNDTVSRIGLLMAEGTANIGILVLHTIESGWLTIDSREETDSYAGKLTDVMNALEDASLQYHLGESRLIKRHGRVENGKFIIGTQSYSVVIVPPAKCLDENTFNMLCEFKRQGGLVIFTGEIPEYTDGVKTEKVISFADNCIKCCLEELPGSIPKDCRLISIEYENSVKRHFIRSNVRRFAEQGMTMYYICNFGDTDDCITVNVKGKSAMLFDAADGCVKPVAFENCGDKLAVKQTVYSKGSIILFVYDSEIAKPAEPNLKSPKTDISDKLKGEWNVSASDYNSLTLDYCDLYVSDEKIAEHLPVIDVQEKLCAFGKRVDAKIVFRFNIKETEFSECKLLIETPEIFEISLNGEKVENKVTGYIHDVSFKTVDIVKHLKTGENELCLRCDFEQSAEVYKALKDVLKFEAAKNKFTYGKEIETVYLKGDFGVYTDEEFTEAENDSVKTCGGFYLGKAPKTVNDGILEKQGYPFFAGSITLSKKIVLSEEEAENAVISFEKLPSTVTAVSANGKSAGKILWKPYRIDISDYVKAGENEISITLTGSLRNLLGPFHLKTGETHFIHPSTFFHETYLWSSGVNPNWSDDYCFVKNGLFFD